MTMPTSLSQSPKVADIGQPHLRREISLIGLVATAFAAMVGVGVNILPFMVQRSQPGIGGWVPLAYVLAALPALLAATCYAVLISAMPCAGGSYVNVTRALNPFAGFVASFSQWFGLSMAMGVVAYFLVPVLRDLLSVAGWTEVAASLDRTVPRLVISVLSLWLAWVVNVLGIRIYQRSIVLMAGVTIVAPIIMTVAGLLNSPATFVTRLHAGGSALPPAIQMPHLTASAFFGTAVVLFSSFIGFDAVAQAGGEARHPNDLARAIMIAIGGVTAYYVCFTWSVYHAVPPAYIYSSALVHDISAPGLIAPLLPKWLSITILASVAVAILKVLPAVMLGNSRTLYAFSADGILPHVFAHVSERFRTPSYSVTATAIAATLCVVGCDLARDFFLGVDLLVFSMVVNFLLVASALLAFPRVNPQLYSQIRFMKSRKLQVWTASAALVLLGLLLLIEVAGDFTSSAPWYMKTTTSWLVVMLVGSVFFLRFWKKLNAQEVGPTSDIFAQLPPD